MEIYNKKAALDLVDNDGDLLQILIDSFLNETRFEKPYLENLIKEGKMNEAASYVHATKGAARQLCMEKLKDSGQQLEDVLRRKSEGNLQELTDKMFQDYEEAVNAVK
ncbi:MAG: Hpt domain-containing protein [Treponema sp.]|nr:Hpt domain-containing protein [Treponema sp.]